MSQIVSERLTAAYLTARAALLAERNAAGHWQGELSTSALSTATAISAFALVQRQKADDAPLKKRIAVGIDWLLRHQNTDGGWGDTVVSVSNISTSMLVWAAFHLTNAVDRSPPAMQRLQGYIQERCGSTPAQQAEAIRARYGKDRTFAVPILTACALAGLVPWSEVPSLPFELACFPQAWFRFLQLPMVSYALPALIAIGQAIYHHRRPRNPVIRLIRRLSVQRSLRVLETIQPTSGGFLEATPLTSFVTLSLASIGQGRHPVARKGIEFLVKSMRQDGSWPIDTNLATWVTTLSINALAAAGDLDALDKKPELAEWLLRQQYTERHPFTGAEPGGWGWTDLPGSVPDADDTPGALLALAHLGERGRTRGADATPLALRWLCRLQNRDGGWPTFCRGWGHLPFDRSGPDLTAHALRALSAWSAHMDMPAMGRAMVLDQVRFCAKDTNPKRKRGNVSSLTLRVGVTSHKRSLDWALAHGLDYLARTQRPDGSWLPLWFGNQYAPDDENPTYGTARVLAAYRTLDMMNTKPAQRGVAWLLANQNADGGWGGCRGTPSTMEETALAVEALLDAGAAAEPAVNSGLAWLVQGVESGGLQRPAPIGFYFAKLWYFEKLYPIIFTVSALGSAHKKYAIHPNSGR